MEWVSSWIQGIIIAVIIATIIEMILPEGTSKKYIKVVIGVYILFSIVSPVITKVTGTNFNVSDVFDLDEYIEASNNSNTLQNQLSDQNESQIKEVYLSSIKNDIKEKIENKGYTVDSIEIEVENNEQYTLKSLNLQTLKKDTNTDIETSNTNQTISNVNEVKIEVKAIKSNETNLESSEINQTKNEMISNKEKNELKEYLSSVYEINTKNIFINE